MLTLIISIGCVILIFYKLYSVLGYHEEEDNQPTNNNIKDITNSAEATKTISEDEKEKGTKNLDSNS